MKRKLIILYIAFCAITAHAQTVTVEVNVDKPSYKVGQTVNWSVYVWSDSTSNQGISLISVNLDDDTGDVLSLPDYTGSNMTDMEFIDTEYGLGEKFVVSSPGILMPSAPRLFCMGVMQFPDDILYNVGNDNNPHLLCHGSYVASTPGSHILSPAFSGVAYWNMAGNTTPYATQNQNAITATFDVVDPQFCGDTGTVYLIGDISGPLNQPDCYVDLYDFLHLASEWMNVDCAGNQDCSGADINQSGVVDMVDIAMLVRDWLDCTDPENGNCN